MLSERIAFIVSYLNLSSLLDTVHFAAKPPFYPQSNSCRFLRKLVIRCFSKLQLLDLSISLRSLLTYLADSA